MARLIDASKIVFSGETFTDSDDEIYVRMLDVKQAIWQTPTADVVEAKHGRWIIVQNNLSFVDGKCSECGYTDCFDESGFYNYCPACGAKMNERNNT